MTNLQETDYAWLAGLLDGEGTVSVYKRTNGNYYAYVSIAMADDRTIDCLHDKFGGNVVTHYKGTDKHRAVRRWSPGVAIIQEFLPRTVSYMVTKQEQAYLVLEFLALGRIKDREVAEKFRSRLSGLNRKGPREKGQEDAR